MRAPAWPSVSTATTKAKKFNPFLLSPSQHSVIKIIHWADYCYQHQELNSITMAIGSVLKYVVPNHMTFGMTREAADMILAVLLTTTA